MNLQCLFGHSRTWHRGSRGAKLCDRCQQPIGVMLAGEMINTPLPQQVAGEPTGHAKRTVKDNVTPWKVSSR